MQQFIPANLDIDKLLKKYPPKNIGNFKKDNLIYILHLITSIPATNKDLDIIDGYVPIYSKLLQNKIRHYRQYFDYLIDTAKVLLTNNSYVVGNHSIGYKFAPHYSKMVKPVTIYDRSLQAAISKESRFSATIKKKYHHTIKWYGDGLQINYDMAMDYIAADLGRKLKNPELLDYDAKTKKPKNPYTQYNCAAVNIARIAAGEFRLSIDDNVFRLHSTISNLKSDVRNCITYNGQPLVSVDIKNSQPYISTVILKNSFWEKSRKSGINDKIFNINTLSNSILKGIFPNISNINSYIMLCKSATNQYGSDLQRYKDLVAQGLFYEHLQEQIGKELNISYNERKKIKVAVFQLLFTDNRFLGQAEAKPKRLFKELFPNVYELFARIKRTHKTNLPRLLQRIESHLMLLVVAKRIAKEKPRLPIFTIHDSIVTTVGNEDYVQEILKEEMAKAIGFAPKLQLEYWHPSNLKFNDGEIFYGDERIAV